MTADEPSSPPVGATPSSVADRADSAPVLVLPSNVERELADHDETLGVAGKPFDRASPFFVGLTGALGVAATYVLVRGIADVTGVLVLIGLALFLAIGLNPVIEWLIARHLTRGIAVAMVVTALLATVTGFVLAAVPPITHEVRNLVTDYPRYKANLAAGRGWLGKLAVKFGLTGYLRSRSPLKLPIGGGLLGAGKIILSLGAGTVSVVALTTYFLIALPGVKRIWLALLPRTRRDRVGHLTDEVFDRVGGFMLGNLLTSVVSGVGTIAWLALFGVPYPVLLGLFVALFDLIPIIGSTIAGIVVSLVALTKGIPIGIGTGAFYVVYRFLEDYFLNPRVMKHTVKVTPGLTIIATLIGAALLGLLGALVAIPMAATIHLLLEEVTIPRQNVR